MAFSLTDLFPGTYRGRMRKLVDSATGVYADAVALLDASGASLGTAASPVYTKNAALGLGRKLALVDGGGAVNANGNYAATPTAFFAAPSAGKRWEWLWLSVMVADGAVFGPAEFGGLGTSLANGILPRVWTTAGGGSEVASPVAGAIANNRSMDRAASSRLTIVEGTDSAWTWFFDFTALLGGPLSVSAAASERAEVYCSDNQTGLSALQFEIGVREFDV